VRETMQDSRLLFRYWSLFGFLPPVIWEAWGAPIPADNLAPGGHDVRALPRPAGWEEWEDTKIVDLEAYRRRIHTLTLLKE
jgi:hypothetical protein